MSDRKQNRPYHTRLDNLISDFIIPLLNEGEAKCLLYINRRTTGFNDKEWDRISLSQFEHGIKNGDKVFDLGTGMSRASITNALKSLVEKELVKEMWACTNCFWFADSDRSQGARMKCKRCGRSCDKTYSLLPQSAKKMLHFLNKYDKKERHWSFDTSTMRFQAEEQEAEPTLEVTMNTVTDYADQLWEGKILNEIVRQAKRSVNRTEPLEPKHLLNWFIKPVLELQELAADYPPAVKYALQETLNRGIAGEPIAHAQKSGKIYYSINKKWHRYARRIVMQQLHSGKKRNQLGEMSGPIEGLEQWANGLLLRSYDLNEKGEGGAARQLLSELLGKTTELSSLFDNDTDRTDYAIRWAFKIGEDDLKGALDNTSPVYDFYPEWPD